MDEKIDAQQMWSKLWLEMLPPEARNMVEAGAPLMYVRELFPSAEKKIGDQGLELQMRLASLLAARVHASSTARRFESFFLGFCLDYKIDPNAIGRSKVEWREGFKRLEEQRLLTMFTPEFDPGARNAYNRALLPLQQLIVTLSWWLLCTDASLRENEPELRTTRYAALFFDLLEVGDQYRRIMLD